MLPVAKQISHHPVVIARMHSSHTLSEPSNLRIQDRVILAKNEKFVEEMYNARQSLTPIRNPHKQIRVKTILSSYIDPGDHDLWSDIKKAEKELKEAEAKEKNSLLDSLLTTNAALLQHIGSINDILTIKKKSSFYNPTEGDLTKYSKASSLFTKAASKIEVILQPPSIWPFKLLRSLRNLRAKRLKARCVGPGQKLKITWGYVRSFCTC